MSIEMNIVTELTSVVDPRVVCLLGQEVADLLESLNYDNVAHVWTGIQLHENSFRELLGGRFDCVEQQLSALISNNAMANFRNNRNELVLIIHDPIKQARFAELYAIAGVKQVCDIPANAKALLEPWNLIAHIDPRRLSSMIPLLQRYEADTGDDIYLEPVKLGGM